MLSLLRQWLWDKKPPLCRWDRAYHVFWHQFVVQIQTVCFALVPLRQGCSSRQQSWSRSWTRWCWQWGDLDYWRHTLNHTKALMSKLQVHTVCVCVWGVCTWVICIVNTVHNLFLRIVNSLSACSSCWAESWTTTSLCFSCCVALPPSTERQLATSSW